MENCLKIHAFALTLSVSLSLSDLAAWRKDCLWRGGPGTF